jgi:hypothetical protein
MRTDGLDGLRSAVAAHDGPGRTRPLVELGHALAERYWRAGPGTPAAQPVLDEALAVLGEAYRYFEPDDGMGGQVANLMGWLHGIRHIAHGGPVADREAGITLLTASSRFTQLPPFNRAIGRLVLGQLLLSRVTAGMQAGGMAMLAPGSGANADADRAVDCFRQVLAEPVGNAELTTMAQTLLSLAEALRDMTSGSLDLSKMMTVMATLQNLRRPGPADSVQPPLLHVNDLAEMFTADPLKRPTAVVDGDPGPPPAAGPTPLPKQRPAAPEPARPEPARPEPARPEPARPTPARPAAPRVRAAAFREPLQRLVSGPAALLAWLGDDDAAPTVDTVDQVLALSASLVAAEGATNLDHLLLAAGLYLRGRDQIDGWAAGDLDAAVAALRTAARGLPTAPAGLVIAAARLAARLDARRPGAGARPHLAEHLAGTEPEPLLFRAEGHTMLLTPAGLEEHDGDLPERVLVVGDPPTGTGPAVVSHVFTAAQAGTLAARTRRPIADDPVFLANPRGDRPGATMDAWRLRREFYPRSTGLGETVENVDGTGTAAEVTAKLGASVLHLGCGLTPDGALELAGGDTLLPPAAAAARTGGVALLPPSPHGARAAEALLGAGFVSVVALAADVPDRVASLLYFLLHAALVDESLPPAEAVRAVRTRLAAGTLPEFLPADLAAAADPSAGRLLTCYGR